MRALTFTPEWPRCEDCGAELQEVHSELPRECPQCRLSAKLHLADMKNVTLTAERDEGKAEISCLIAERDVLRVAASDLLRALGARDELDAGFKGMGHNILVEKASHVKRYARVLAKLAGGGNE